MNLTNREVPELSAVGTRRMPEFLAAAAHSRRRTLTT